MGQHRDKNAGKEEEPQEEIKAKGRGWTRTKERREEEKRRKRTETWWYRTRGDDAVVLPDEMY